MNSGKIGGRILLPMCNFRYEIYRFLNGSTLVIPPPPSSSPPPPASPVPPSPLITVKPKPEAEAKTSKKNMSKKSAFTNTCINVKSSPLRGPNLHEGWVLGIGGWEEKWPDPVSISFGRGAPRKWHRTIVKHFIRKWQQRLTKMAAAIGLWQTIHYLKITTLVFFNGGPSSKFAV